MSPRITPHVSLLASALGLALASGCPWKDNPNHCPGANPNDNCHEDAGGSPPQCQSSAECSAPTPVCDLGDAGVCVQCTPAEAAACTGPTPVCDADRTCRACATHAECPLSSACLPDGRCAAPTAVAYVQAGATGAQPCTKAAPCGTLQEGVTAITQSRPYIKISGTAPLTASAITTIDGKAVTILADPGAKLDRTGDGAILEVRNTGADVRIYDLEITGATGAAGDVGILIPASGMPKLTLTRVKVTNNQGGGIAASGGSLSVTESTISGNSGGGISVMNGTFVIVGNVFFGNGSLMGTIGGISISTTQNEANRLEFNSFNSNQTQLGVGAAIHCIAGTFTARNNILSENGTLTNMEQVGGTCAHAYSIVRPGALPAGPGNSAVDPLFVNTTTGDLHLRPGSPALGAADPSADLTGVAARDLDGNLRVAPADIGADEVP